MNENQPRHAQDHACEDISQQGWGSDADRRSRGKPRAALQPLQARDLVALLRHHTLQLGILILFNHVVDESKLFGWHLDAECFRGCEIDRQLGPDGQEDRQGSGILTPADAVACKVV